MGIVCSIGMLWCRAGCSVSRVASMLAFYPPRPPYYTIKEDPNTGNLELWLDPVLSPVVLNLQSQHMEVGFVSTSRGQRIAVVLFQRPSATITLLYSHANATDLGVMLDRFAEMSQRLDVNVVGYDYTGYGSSSGEAPSEEDAYADVQAAYAWAINKAPNTRVVLYGQSVGSGPSVFLATSGTPLGHCCVPTLHRGKRARTLDKAREGQQAGGGIAGLILHSGLASGMRVVTDSRALACLDIFPNVERLSCVQCPVLVIHGTDDQEVHLQHGEALQQAVPSQWQREPFWVPGGAHNDIGEGIEGKAEYYRRLRAFLSSLPPPPPAALPSPQPSSTPLSPSTLKPAIALLGLPTNGDKKAEGKRGTAGGTGVSSLTAVSPNLTPKRKPRPQASQAP